MIYLKRVEPIDKERLFNLFQKMLYEMTQFYDNEIDELGLIHYGYFDEYFIDPNRFAYFIYHEEQLVGFMMIHKYSYFDLPIDFNMAEFTIFPSFRKQGFGVDAVREVLKKHQGIWEIKYNLTNEKANLFWHKVLKEYKPNILKYEENEEVFRFEV